MIPIEKLFVPCITCGEEHRYLEMSLCVHCEEPICQFCLRPDGFCGDDCYSEYSDEVSGDEDWRIDE